jgi:cytoskeletal protein RodZ
MSLENLTLGTEIRDARERAGFSVVKIAEITRIRETLIKDIESDQFESCGGNAYARGHIRTIAKVLNLNADLLIEKFAQTTGDFDRPMVDLLEENNVIKQRAPRPAISFKALASVAAGVVALLIAVPAVISLFPNDTTSPLAPSSQGLAPSTTEQNSQVVASATSGVSLVVSGISGKSWIGIQDASGAQIFSGSINAGEVKSFSEDQFIHAIIGNAAAVSLNVNGQEIGTPGGVGEVVHLSFTPNGSNNG